MIPVQVKPEPASFDTRVRRKGNAFLASEGVPSKASAFRNYWKRISQELYSAYDGVCAYTCTYLVGPGTVDHFLPKTKFPHLAYEWSNYRLASERANQRKGENTDLLDPFRIKKEWFILDFPSCLVVLGGAIPIKKLSTAQKTIEVLKLNDDDNLVQERCNIIMLFVDGSVRLDFLRQRHPFIAWELERQGLTTNPGNVFKRRTK